MIDCRRQVVSALQIRSETNLGVGCMRVPFLTLFRQLFSPSGLRCLLHIPSALFSHSSKFTPAAASFFHVLCHLRIQTTVAQTGQGPCTKLDRLSMQPCRAKGTLSVLASKLDQPLEQKACSNEFLISVWETLGVRRRNNYLQRGNYFRSQTP